jgi:hypothetical protein
VSSPKGGFPGPLSPDLHSGPRQEADMIQIEPPTFNQIEKRDELGRYRWKFMRRDPKYKKAYEKVINIQTYTR